MGNSRSGITSFTYIHFAIDCYKSTNIICNSKFHVNLRINDKEVHIPVSNYMDYAVDLYSAWISAVISLYSLDINHNAMDLK